ncbi:hypothetical protein MRB53_039789 [Persea americana]|nr:hypothetical protein MRB53_039789 [Persea americana]
MIGDIKSVIFFLWEIPGIHDRKALMSASKPRIVCPGEFSQPFEARFGPSAGRPLLLCPIALTAGNAAQPSRIVKYGWKLD